MNVITTMVLGAVAIVALIVTGFRRGQAPVDVDGMRRTLDELRTGERRAVAERDARLERLEHAVDAIAIEMERIGESQRFLTKVLAERAPDQKLADPTAARGRLITPH